jgi:hypothetical protein
VEEFLRVEVIKGSRDLEEMIKMGGKSKITRIGIKQRKR